MLSMAPLSACIAEISAGVILQTVEAAVRCVWKKADSKREGESFSGNGTRIL